MDCSELEIVVTKSPSYLSTLQNCVEDIILVHKLGDPANESYYIPTPVKRKNDIDNLDITGSPLKVDLNDSSFLSIDSVNSCVNFWHKNEEKYFPIPYFNAQKYIQDYLFKNYKNQKEITTWWILDGADDEKTVLMSALQMPTYISRSKVKLGGYLPKSHPSIEFDALCDKHFEIIGKIAGGVQKIPLRQLVTNVSCTFELCGTKISAENFSDKSEIAGSVVLDVNWSQCCAEIPLDHSKSVMTVQTIVGQPKSKLFRFWEELILLELYIKTLNEYNFETMLDNHWLPSHSVSSNDSDLINKIIETVHNCEDAPRFNINKEGVPELIKIIENVDGRRDRDITDQLWIVLNKCSTYGALTECLNIIFTEIINSDRSAYIADSNITSMAQIIRDIVAGKTSVFMLKGTQPIELLIDIGLEKLRKDFTHIFTQFGIATNQELKELFNQNSSLPDSKQIRSALYHKQSILNLDNVDNRMKILGKLHTILETLILVPSFWQSLSSKIIYDHYIGKDSPIISFSDLARNKLYEINVELPVSKVVGEVKMLSPTTWRLSLTLKKPSYSIKNVFHLSQMPIFPPILYKTDFLQESINDDNFVYYHYTLMTQMTNFINTNLI